MGPTHCLACGLYGLAEFKKGKIEMEFETIKIDVQGREVDAFDIPIQHCVDKASEVHLEDGTILLIKTSVLKVARAISEYAPNGDPLYNVQSANLIGVKSCPNHLRQRGE